MKEALYRATAVLGRASQDAIFQDLELKGMRFDEPCTVRQVNEALKGIFGLGATLLIRRLERELE